MSRAFVKEDDGRPEQSFDRPISDKPNYVTTRGLQLLRDALARAQRTGNERELKYYRERVDSAIERRPESNALDVVGFGASVQAHDGHGTTLAVRIVGEDEAEPTVGAISWTSPIAQALANHKVGDVVTVQRPAGALQYTIDSVRYED